MKITIIGTGYVGLVTGACLAEIGNDVLCLDVDARKIAMLNDGGIPIYEPGLDELVERNVAAGRLQLHHRRRRRAWRTATLQFIAVGTPPDEDGSADLQYVLAAARNIGRHMTTTRSSSTSRTVPVGTGDKVRGRDRRRARRARRRRCAFAVVSNPEFLKEGAAVEDFMRPDRIVIGADDERADARLMRALYAPFKRNHERTAGDGRALAPSSPSTRPTRCSPRASAS